ncbi:hypothetical protein D3C86_1499330 [compost metagenome]
MAAKHARWNIGMTCSITIVSSKVPVIGWLQAEETRFVWLSITPLGKPVVPPV